MRIVGSLAVVFAASSGFAQSVTFIDPPGAQRDLLPNALSPDGLTVVGTTFTPNQQYPFVGFRWTASQGVTFLPAAQPNAFAEPAAVSVGGVIVGDSAAQAFVWSAATGPTIIGPHRSSARDLSADGTMVVGFTVTNQMQRGFVRVGPGALASLEPSVGMTDSSATAVSADGLTTVGRVFRRG